MTLPVPQGVQKEVVCLRHEGHTVVLGTAGSGKTTMAIHRAAYLADPRTDHSGRTLLVTYNGALLAYLRFMQPPELTNADVITYHSFALGYLAQRGLMGPDWIAGNHQRERLIQEALTSVRERANGSPVLQRPPEFFFREIRWMNQHGLVDRDAYVAADRVGRDPLARGMRPAVFDVFATYRKLRERAGLRYDWDDVALAARQALQEDEEERLYRHVVIDEGQDFSPEMIRSLALAIPPGGSLTLFGDVAQQIYGRRLSWRQAGLDVGSIWRFRKNYRNSPQIAGLGLAIAAMPYFADEPDMVPPDEFAADGPLPSLVPFDDPVREIAFVIEQARAAAQSGSVGVLVRRHADAAPYRQAFPGAQRLRSGMTTWRPEPGISFGTLHAAKGFEFDTVILPALTDARLPDPVAVQAEGETEAVAQDGRLLYVGITRARRSLIMTHTGKPTELLPPNDGLWVEQAS